MDELRDRSLSELLGDLSRDTATIIRKEFELAQVELRGIASEAARHTVAIIVGGAICYAGLLGLLATLVLAAISAGLSPPLAALLVSMVVVMAGGFLIQRGLSAFRRAALVPSETVRTVRETVGYVKQNSH